MKDKWILDVLDNLLIFAERNELPALAAGVTETRRIALAELAARENAALLKEKV
jgi:hypothetical protein